jgi:hypothetical protein
MNKQDIDNFLVFLVGMITGGLLMLFMYGKV